MLDLRLYMLQRLTALIMIPLVIGHLITMVIAVQDGLTANEILSRAAGSLFWFVFYLTFALSAAMHGAIGLRVVVHEWLGLGGVGLSVFTWVVALSLSVLGCYAVVAVTWL